MDKSELDAHRSHAWTLAIITWLAGAALLFGVSDWISSVKSSDTREWLYMGFYPVSFFYFLALGLMQERFLTWLCERSERAKSSRVE